MKVPDAFGARIAEHNRSCCIAATLSLSCAAVAWTAAGVVYASGALLFETHASEAHELRLWFYRAGFFAIAGSLAGAIVGRRLGRFTPPPDRSIIGWHLVADVLLLPARATLLVWDHLNARIVLSRTEREEAWRPMRTVSKMRRADRSLPAGEFPDSARLTKMLEALQFAGWIGLYRSEEDWYYRVRSDQERIVNSLVSRQETS